MSIFCVMLLPLELLGAKEKHGLKAEAMRELGNIQYSVKNVRFVDLRVCVYCLESQPYLCIK